MAPLIRKIAFDTAALILGKATGGLLGIVRLSYISSSLGVENFGILNFAVYFCSLFQVLFDMGVGQITIREIARRPQQSRELVGSILFLKLLIVAAAALIIGTVTILLGFDETTTIAVAFTTVAVGVNGVSAVFLAAFQAHQRMGFVSVTTLISDILLSLSVIGLIRDFPSITTVIALTLLIAVANLFLLGGLYRRYWGAPVMRADVELWRMFLRESAPIAVNSVGVSVYMFAGPTLLKFIRGNDEVGIFSAGLKVISVLTIIPMSLSQVVYPIFSAFTVTAREKLNKALGDSLRVMFQISLPTAVGVALLAPEIIGLLFPQSFAEATLVLRLTVSGVALGYPAWILAAFLLAVGQQKYCMWTSVAVAVASVAANLFLIPKFGYLAVAGVGIATDFLLFFILAYFTWTAGYSVRGEVRFFRVFAASAVLAAILVGLKPLSVPLAFLAGATGYSLILLLTGALGKQEKEILSKIFRI